MAWCDVVEPRTLRDCRIALGQSQAAFAAMLGASPESYRTWDAGRRATPLKILARAKALATHRDDHALLPLPVLALLIGVHVKTLRSAARDGRLLVTYDTRTTFRRLRARATPAAARAFRRSYYGRPVQPIDRRAPLTWASVPDDYRTEGAGPTFPVLPPSTVATRPYLVLTNPLRLKRFSDSPCTAWARRGTSACTNAGGPMQAYSMDLRERALLDSDAGMKAADVAVKYRVSGSWVRLLKQRRRETGEVAPRVQRHGRRRMLEPHLHTLAALIAEQPDRTLAELKDALGTPASLATIWRAVAALDVTVKKNGPALRTRST